VVHTWRAICMGTGEVLRPPEGPNLPLTNLCWSDFRAGGRCWWQRDESAACRREFPLACEPIPPLTATKPVQPRPAALDRYCITLPIYGIRVAHCQA
jgi:hypothetical protein